MFESLSKTVTCTRELISLYMCYSQGGGLNISLSRLSYLVLYTVIQLLSSCLVVHLSLYVWGARFSMLDCHLVEGVWYIYMIGILGGTDVVGGFYRLLLHVVHSLI